MKDRQPTKPNRVAVYDDSHRFLRYEYHERADEPTEAGTPLNKENILKDATATLFGLSADATPDAVFAEIINLVNGKSRVAVGKYNGTGKYGNKAKNTLVFPFKPLAVIVTGRSLTAANKLANPGLVAIQGAAEFVGYIKSQAPSNTEIIHLEWPGNDTLRWYCAGGPAEQANSQGQAYHYIAIG